MAEEVAAAYRIIGQDVPSVSLIRLTASELMQEYDDDVEMRPLMVSTWRNWEARTKSKPASAWGGGYDEKTAQRTAGEELWMTWRVWI